MTKLVTVVAAMHAVDHGVWTLDDDMRLLVPELQKMQILRGFDESDQPILEANTEPITLR